MPSAKTILTRIVFGSIMIAVLAGVLAVEALRPWPTMADFDGMPLAGVMIGLGILGLRELSRMARAAGTSLLPAAATLGTLAVATQPIWHKFAQMSDTLSFLSLMNIRDAWCIVGVVVAAAFLEQMIRHRLDGALARLGMTMLSVTYLGVGAAIVLSIRLQFGVAALVLFLAAVKCTDIGAYFTGTAIGRHKMIPWLSPGKSWEGLLGGLAAAAGASMLVVWALGMELSPARAAAFGAILGAVGQFADLCESLLKRSAKVKDSASLVPEFGGVLDVIDSPLLAAPAAWVMMNWMM